MSNIDTAAAATAPTNTGKPTRAPKVAVESHRGLSAGTRIAAGEATIFMIEQQPRRDNPGVSEPIYALVRVPCPDGGTITLKMDRVNCPSGTHTGRMSWLSEATVGMPLGEIEILELWERNGRIQGSVSARKPAEEVILSVFNAVDESGERQRVFVPTLVLDTPEIGLRLDILDGPAKGWNIFVHVSNVPGGDDTINKCVAGETQLIVEVITARTPDRSRKTEKDRLDIVLQGSFEEIEDKKRADAALLESLAGNRKGALTGVVTGGTKTGFIIEVDLPGNPTFETPVSQRQFYAIGDTINVHGFIEGGSLAFKAGKKISGDK